MQKKGQNIIKDWKDIDKCGEKERVLELMSKV